MRGKNSVKDPNSSATELSRIRKLGKEILLNRIRREAVAILANRGSPAPVLNLDETDPISPANRVSLPQEDMIPSVVNLSTESLSLHTEAIQLQSKAVGLQSEIVNVGIGEVVVNTNLTPILDIKPVINVSVPPTILNLSPVFEPIVVALQAQVRMIDRLIGELQGLKTPPVVNVESPAVQIQQRPPVTYRIDVDSEGIKRLIPETPKVS